MKERFAHSVCNQNIKLVNKKLKSKCEPGLSILNLMVPLPPAHLALTPVLFLLVQATPLLRDVTPPALSPSTPLPAAYDSAGQHSTGCSVSPELGDRSMEKALEEGKLLGRSLWSGRPWR